MHSITRAVLGDPLTITADEPDDGPLRITITPTDAYTVTNPNVNVSLETTTIRTDDGTTELPAEPLRTAFPRDVLDTVLNNETDRQTRAGLVYRYMGEDGYSEDDMREYVRVVRAHGRGWIDAERDVVVFQRQRRHPATRVTVSYTGDAVRTAGPLEVELTAEETYEHVVVAGEYAFDEATVEEDDTTVVVVVPRRSQNPISSASVYSE